MQLNPPTPIDQLGIGWDACGQSQVTSILIDAGINVSLSEVADVAIANRWVNPNGETNAADLVALLAHYGVTARWKDGIPLAVEIPAALNLKHRCIVMIASDGDGNPVRANGKPSQIAHWLGIFGDQAGDYQVMQSLGPTPGINVSYAQALLVSADRFSYVEVMQVLPKDREAEDVRLGIFVAKIVNPQPGQTVGESAQNLTDGMRFHWIQSARELADVTALTGPWCNGGAPVETWGSGEPVDDVLAFGRPDDAVTASMYGLPFP